MESNKNTRSQAKIVNRRDEDDVTALCGKEIRNEIKTCGLVEKEKVPPVTMTETRRHKLAKLSPPEKVIEDDRRCFQNNQNPLMVQLVLECLFEFCSGKTLLNCRLVCKTWKDVASKQWQKKTVLCFRKKLKVNRKCPSNEMKSTFGSHVILKNIKGKCQDLKLFLSEFQFLQVLDVRNCEWNGKLDISNVSLQQLEQLKIHRNDGDNMLGLENYRLLNWFPNLRAFSLVYREKEGGYLHPKSFKCFVKNLNKYARTEVMCLRELDLILDVPQAFVNNAFQESLYVSVNFLKPIVECKLPFLEKLVLELMWISDIEMKKVARLLFKLLHTCKESLHYLRTFFRFEIPEYINNLLGKYISNAKNRPIGLLSALTPIRGIKIKMDQLNNVELGNSVWGFFLLAHLELPNLKKLKVYKGESSEKMNIQPFQMKHIKDVIFPNLETFELHFTHQVPLSATMHAFAVMMPNLINLSIPLDKDAFQIVCERFSRLKTLNILDAMCVYRSCKKFMHTYNRLDDETLTGVSVDGTEGEKTPNRFNITHLTHLANLTISSECTFTEHTVMYGFLKLPMLYNLKASLKKISNEAKTELIKHVRGTVEIQYT